MELVQGYMRASKVLSRTTSFGLPPVPLTLLPFTSISLPLELVPFGEPLQPISSPGGGSLQLVDCLPASVMRVMRMAAHLK